MIDRRLHTLRAVHYHGTVTAAAQALHFTPSAVSQQIRQLACELGVDLLEPHGRNVRLTDAALALVDHADALFARWEEARADLAEHAEGVSGVLRMCGFPTALAALVAPAVVALQAEYPLLSVYVRESCDKALDLLLSSEVDIAVMSAAPDTPSLDDPRFEQQPLLDESQDLLVPADHPLAGRAEVALHEAAREPWIVPVAGSSEQRELTLVACAAAGFTPTVVHQAREWAAVRALVAHGLGVALVPQLAGIRSDDAVVRLPICSEPQPSRRIVTCVRRGSRDHPTIRRGLDALQAASAARYPSSACHGRAQYGGAQP
jgi:DNA-binding transcriptional LysR family regulator